MSTSPVDSAAVGPSRLDVLHGYLWVFVAAFVVTLLATPLMRRLAIANDVIDHPSDPRKVHRIPIAYLGGVAVFLGLMAGVLCSYLAQFVPGVIRFHPTTHLVNDLMVMPVRASIVMGMFLIMLVGMLDDVLKISPRVKLAGQLVAAAALAIDDVGVKVASGLLLPAAELAGIDTSGGEIAWTVGLPFAVMGYDTLTFDLVYWSGTAIIGLFVLGACNAANLIDGLDGLLSGTTAIASCGLLVVALALAVQDDGPRDGMRIVLCLSLLGACLGFLPHNFNPATIFLGDCGSLLLGFVTIVIILTLGDTGRTELVLAGLIIYAIPIIDTVLAIVRRKMEGKRISDADDQHLHHMLKRALGVKGAVLTLYGLAGGFAALGVAMSLARARVIYAVTLVFASFIVVTAVKIARRRQIESAALARTAGQAAPRPGPSDQSPTPVRAAAGDSPLREPDRSRPVEGRPPAAVPGARGGA